MDISGKTILITGAAVRVGRAISLELASAGAQLFCHFHSSSDAAESLASDLSARNCTYHIIQADLRKITHTNRLVEKAVERFGRVDVLINNAAVFYRTPLESVTEEDWDTFFDLNLKSAFFLARAAGLHMRKQGGGKIINIGDAAASSPFPAYLPYTLTKAGIVAMTRGLAKALAPEVQVNCINPGPVMMPQNQDETERRFALQQTLLKREGEARDVARAVRFLIEGSDFITGAVLPVDGGRQAR